MLYFSLCQFKKEANLADRLKGARILGEYWLRVLIAVAQGLPEALIWNKTAEVERIARLDKELELGLGNPWKKWGR